jgi:hypothetical protein
LTCFQQKIGKLQYRSKNQKFSYLAKKLLIFSFTNEFFKGKIFAKARKRTRFRFFPHLELIHELGCGDVDLVLHVDSDPVQDLPQLSQLLPVRQALVTQYGLNATSSENLPKIGLKYC